jgi:hypothetical protein
MKCCKRHMLFIHIQFELNNVLSFSEYVLFNPLFQRYHVVSMLYFRGPEWLNELGSWIT